MQWAVFSMLKMVTASAETFTARLLLHRCNLFGGNDGEIQAYAHHSAVFEKSWSLAQ